MGDAPFTPSIKDRITDLSSQILHFSRVCTSRKGRGSMRGRVRVGRSLRDFGPSRSATIAFRLLVAPDECHVWRSKLSGWVLLAIAIAGAAFWSLHKRSRSPFPRRLRRRVAPSGCGRGPLRRRAADRRRHHGREHQRLPASKPIRRPSSPARARRRRRAHPARSRSLVSWKSIAGRTWPSTCRRSRVMASSRKPRTCRSPIATARVAGVPEAEACRAGGAGNAPPALKRADRERRSALRRRLRAASARPRW